MKSGGWELACSGISTKIFEKVLHFGLLGIVKDMRCEHSAEPSQAMSLRSWCDLGCDV